MPTLHATDRRGGCLDCLKDGRFEIVHDTDLGALENGRFLHFDPSVGEMVVQPVPPGLRPEVLSELPLTPGYRSHQGCHFPMHCRDAMAYIGRWTPADFLRARPDDPKAFYLSTSDGDPQLWDETEAELGTTTASWPTAESTEWAWGSWCYLFRCLRCGHRSSHRDTR